MFTTEEVLFIIFTTALSLFLMLLGMSKKVHIFNLLSAISFFALMLLLAENTALFLVSMALMFYQIFYTFFREEN